MTPHRGSAGQTGAESGREPAFLAAITAAGEGSRMGYPKPLLPLGESTFLGTMIATLREAGVPGCAVVVGAGADRLLPLVRGLGATPLVNDKYMSGRFTSIRLAARWACERARARAADAEALRPGLLLWPIDCPAVSPTTIRRLLEEARSGGNVIPRFGGRSGHPVVLGAALLDRILEADDSSNLRDLLRADPPSRVDCAVDDPAVLDNVNTPQDYAELLRGRSPGMTAPDPRPSPAATPPALRNA